MSTKVRSIFGGLTLSLDLAPDPYLLCNFLTFIMVHSISAPVPSMSHLRSCGESTLDPDPALDPYLCCTFSPELRGGGIHSGSSSSPISVQLQKNLESTPFCVYKTLSAAYEWIGSLPLDCQWAITANKEKQLKKLKERNLTIICIEHYKVFYIYDASSNLIPWYLWIMMEIASVHHTKTVQEAEAMVVLMLIKVAMVEKSQVIANTLYLVIRADKR